ncbi:MAG: hypothetical protein JWO36_307 [Myxococcales bacterium]|nr:hypothetical protein [Myxococcales bacterium]
MRAWFRFGACVAACLAVAACHPSTGATPIENRALATSDVVGGYWCRIEDAGFKYERFPCAIRRVDDHLVLAKLGGSQRFEGELLRTRDGFLFDGRFYCPWGDCTQALHGVIEPQANGTLRGTFRDAKFTVVLARAPDSAFGGASYGGDGYGGFSDGGAVYGGTPRK